jgi:hypothetical protein
MRIDSFITLWLLHIGSFFLGYIIGRDKLKWEEIKEVRKDFKSKLSDLKAGPIMRPTAKQVFYQKHPILKDTEDAFREGVKNIKELNNNGENL